MRIRMLPHTWRPPLTAWADSAETDNSDMTHVAPRDAGWVELLSADGDVRYGRGHLMIWMEPPDRREDGRIRAELHSFTADEEPREGVPLVVAPEQESDHYPVTFRGLDAIEREHGGLVRLFWDDEVLPASLRELGGH